MMILRLRWSDFLLMGCFLLLVPASPFQVGRDLNVELHGRAFKTLAQGKPYETTLQAGSSMTKIIVQDVKAPVKTVLDRILDFDQYKVMVPNMLESEIYKRVVIPNENENQAAERLGVRLMAGSRGFWSFSVISCMIRPRMQLRGL